MKTRLGSDGNTYALASDGEYYQVDATKLPKADESNAERPKPVVNPGWNPYKTTTTAETPYHMLSPQEKLARDTGPLDTALISAGRTTDKLLSGVTDLSDIANSWVTDEDGKKVIAQRRADRQKEQASNDRAYEPLANESPIATTMGEIAPMLATLPMGLTTTAVKGASHLVPKTATELAKFLGKNTAIGATEGAAHYDDSALGGAATGLGFSAGGKWLGNVLGGGKSNLVGDAPEIVKFAKDEGLFVPPGMASGDITLQQMDSGFQTNRATSNDWADRNVQSKIKENNLISKEIGGEKADFLTDSYLANEKSRIGNTMDDLVTDINGNFTEDQAYKAIDIIEEYRLSTPKQESNKLLDSIAARISNDEKPLTGKEFQTFTQRINRAANKQFKPMTGDADLGGTLNQLGEIFNDAAEESLQSKGGSDAFRKARREYALVSAVEKSKLKTTPKAGIDGVAGFVDADKLAKDFKSSDVINKLGKVQQLRNGQAPTSLSTNQMLANMTGGAMAHPSKSLGMAGALMPRLTDGLPVLPKMASDLYMSGYPHVTGLAPILGKYTNPALSEGIPRAAMGKEKDQTQEKADKRARDMDELLISVGLGN